MNTIILVTVTNFSGTTTPDKNGEMPIMLQCLAGSMPNRNVLSGTVGRRAGLEVGKTYLVNVRENGTDELFGQDFTFTKVMELTSGLDVIKAAKEIGDPQILNITRPAGFEQHYKRKGDAVESNRTKRIKEGLFHPLYPITTANHATAADIKSGSSVGSGGEIITEERPAVDDLPFS